jgi:hypothetical protein
MNLGIRWKEKGVVRKISFKVTLEKVHSLFIVFSDEEKKGKLGEKQVRP